MIKYEVAIGIFVLPGNYFLFINEIYLCQYLYVIEITGGGLDHGTTAMQHASVAVSKGDQFYAFDH